MSWIFFDGLILRLRLPITIGLDLGFFLEFLSSSSRSSGVARHASHFLYSLRSPYGAPFRRSANYAVQQQKK